MNPKAILRRVWYRLQPLTSEEYNFLASAYEAAGYGKADDATALQMCLTLCGLYDKWKQDGEPRDSRWFDYATQH